MEGDPNLEMMQIEEVSTIVVGEVDEVPRKGPRIPLDHACKVCGAPASAYLHYGAIVCYSCRAFFRRAIRKNFVCRVGDYSCIMEGTRSNRCRGCRYRKCLQVGMKPEMVDAMLKRNPDGGKRRRKAENTIGKVNTQPVFSRSSDLAESPASVETESSAECQEFFVFNKSTQAYEPITIISIGEEGEEQPAVEYHHRVNTSKRGAGGGGRGGGGGTSGSQEEMFIFRAVNGQTLQALNLNTDLTVVSTSDEVSSVQEEKWIDNIVTDHEEVVQTQTCSEPDPLTIETTTLSRMPADLVVCHISDAEVIKEEVIHSN